MGKQTLAGQLRVRVDSAQMSELRKLIGPKADRGALSNLIRQAITDLLARRGGSLPHDLISADCYDRIIALAAKVDRTPSQVLEDCIEGIERLYEKGEVPLIVMEMRLRRDYFQRRETQDPKSI